MDIVIVAQYLRDIENFEGNNSRFVYLAKMLISDRANQVEIITSDFSHGKKKHFPCVGELPGIKVTVCHEPGYPKNVCFKRFVSHKVLAINIKSYLEKRKRPDVVYVAVPSLAVAEICSNYCSFNRIKFIVDIQDLWPEAFKMVLNIPIISDIAFSPMKKQADKIYAAADEIIAVSETYAARGMIVNKKCLHPTIVYLGTEKDTFDRYVNATAPEIEGITEIKKVLDDDRILTLAYCGTLGASYDINCVLDAMRQLDKNVLKNIQFIIMGDGPRRTRLEESANGLPCIFTGLLKYPEMVWILSRCDIAVNPITKGAAQSIINKHMDFAMAGLPVINTQECIEYRRLLEKYKAGINCRCNNAEDIQKAIIVLSNDYYKMGKQSRIMGENEFDRFISYKKIKEVIFK